MQKFHGKPAMRSLAAAVALASLPAFSTSLTALAAPVHVDASTVTANSPQAEFEQAFQEFLVPDATSPSRMRFDFAKAGRMHASGDIVMAGRFYARLATSDAQVTAKARAVATTRGSVVSPGGSTDAVAIPIWGNWCGSGYGSGTPRDLLDTACMHHDKCYGSKGYWNCDCDRTLIAEINRDYGRMHFTEKVAANAVKAFFVARDKVAC